MPGSLSVPPHLIQYVASPQTSTLDASEALEEWILQRRGKGDTLFEVSVGLAELEDRTPPQSRNAFSHARYITNVPSPSDLTPPIGPFPLSRSASPVTILHHLLSQPPPSIEHSREVILEYVLAREMKLREKKPGRAGKGTLGREGFEDIAHRLSEIEEGLRIPNVELADLSQNRQLGLALILSLRMSLSYFTLQQLAEQLSKLALQDAERVIVQHIRKRIPGEGRHAVGMELQYLEQQTASRPALRPAFRAARSRTALSDRPYYSIPLPAPTKAVCIKLISAFVKDVEVGGPNAVAQQSIATSSPQTSRSYFRQTSSPIAFQSALAPVESQALPPDSNPIAGYVLELVSEYLTREKREHMLKCKWAVKGRDAVSKDLGEIEMATCVYKNAAVASAPQLIPTYLVLRRTFNLPRSPLPSTIIDPYLDILPAPPDTDDIPFRESTISSTTAKLYVNPRLDDLAALDILEELVETERENVEAAGADSVQQLEWLASVVDQVEKRFPDGSYASVFATIKEGIPSPPQHLAVDTRPQPQKQNSLHRRSASTAAPSTLAVDEYPLSSSLERKPSHNRSTSLPHNAVEIEELETPAPTPPLKRPILSSLETDTSKLSTQYLSPTEVSADRESSGWWDVVSAVDGDNRTSWARTRSRDTDNSLPPGAAPARPELVASPVWESMNSLGLEDHSPVSGDVSFLPNASPPRLPGVRAIHSSPGKTASPNVAINGDTLSSRPPPVPLSFDRPNFPSPTSGTNATASKSKLGTFGRSLSIASKGMLTRPKEKEKPESELGKENEKATGRGKVMNNPGKWNKDLVANIMGPSSEKK